MGFQKLFACRLVYHRNVERAAGDPDFLSNVVPPGEGSVTFGHAASTSPLNGIPQTEMVF